MKKLICMLCACVILLTNLSVLAANYDVKTDMLSSAARGVYVKDNTKIKQYAEKTGLDKFEYGYVAMYGGLYGDKGSDASIQIESTRGAKKLVFDARIIDDDFCSASDLLNAFDPYVLQPWVTLAERTTCTIKLGEFIDYNNPFWSPNPDFPSMEINISTEWKHYEFDLTGVDKCQLFIAPIGAKPSYEMSAAIVANLKLVDVDESYVEPTPKPTKAPTPKPTKTPEPIPSDWAKAEMERAKEYGILGNWITDYQKPITRLEFAHLIVDTVFRFSNTNIYNFVYDISKEIAPELNGSMPRIFEDIHYDHHVFSAVVMGITDGVTDTEFMPDKNITRQEIAVMMHRAIKFLEDMAEEKFIKENSDLSEFSDGNLVAEWAKEGVGTLVNSSIMKGTTDTTLSPLNTTTTEQAIALAARIYEIFYIKLSL